MGKVILIRNHDHAFMSVDGIVRTIRDKKLLKCSDEALIKSVLERSEKYHGVIKQINDTSYYYE